ncbi:MAG: DsbA family oxidoreductase [Alphaproteobacteria bacterium]|jgi:predicted DsbA family dithiol-disulfide isomerase
MILDVFSDPVCPWCFIGKRRLERALREVPEEKRPQIRWRAFMLNPDMPSDGMERNAYLALKFGSSQRAMELYDTIAQAGYQEDILFAFGDIHRTPSTVLAHRLIGLADEHGVQESIVESVFSRYFLKGVNIGEIDNLLPMAVEAGLDEAETRTFLESDQGADTVLTEHNLAQRIGINGVPCFILDGRYAVSGAQSPEVLQRMIETAGETAAI